MFDLKQAFLGLGMSAAQVSELSADTKQRLLKLVVAGVASGQLDQYLNERLRWLEQRDRAAEESPSDRRRDIPAASRVVAAEFTDESAENKRGRR